MGRISRDEMLMETAHVISHRGTCLRSRIGAVIARDARIVSTGYVGSPSGSDHCSVANGCDPAGDTGCIRTVHAEANAIAFAARSGVGTEACVLYTTTAPCRECAKLIINSGIARVVFHSSYRDSSGVELLQAAGIPVERFPTSLTKVDE